MIKVIVTDENDFENLKSQSYYFSERTKVMCFDIDPSNDYFNIVAKYILDDSNVTDKDKENKPKIIFSNGIFIESNDLELADYFGSFVKDNYIRVSVNNWYKVYLLLLNKTVEPDATFKEWFLPMTNNSNINEAKTWNRKVKFRVENWNFLEFSQKALGFNGEKGIKIPSAKFLNEFVMLKDYTIRSGYVIDILDGKKEILFRDSETNDVLNMKIKGWPFRFNSEVWKKEKLISFYCSSKGNDIYNPIIIPEILKINPKDFNDYINKFGYLSNRSCPTELLNRLKAEILIRLLLGKEKK